MMRRLAPFAADLWQHRELLRQFTLRNVELRHKGSHLGLIWSFLNPLLMLGLYVIVFGRVFKGSFGIVPGETKTQYGLGIFIGLTLYHFIAEVMGFAPGIITANANFVKKVVFPLTVLPAAAVGAALFHLLVSLALVLLSVLVAGVPVSFEFLWLPVIVAPLILLGLGLAWLLAGLGVFFRDIGQLTQFLAMVLMWASGVFYSAQKYPNAWEYLRFNPLLLAINLARDVTLWQQPLNLTHLAYLYGVGALAALVGYLAFAKMRPAFADVL